MRKILSGVLAATTAAAMLLTPVMAEELTSMDAAAETDAVQSAEDSVEVPESLEIGQITDDLNGFKIYAPGGQLGAMEKDQDDQGHGNGEWEIWGWGDMYPMDGSEFLFQNGAPWYPDVVKVDFVKNSNQQDCTMTSVGASGFAGCTKLKTITLPNTVNRIDQNGFNGCTSLESITLSSDLTSIGEGTFSGCTSLDNVVIPDGATSIGKNAFKGCTGLTSVTLPNGVTSIEEGTFEGCTNLQTINIPDTVTSIGKNVFKGCTGLESVQLSPRLKTIGEGTFEGCTSLDNVVIPDGVTSIGKNAFKGCTGLTSVTLPNGVTSIEEGTFEGCTDLQTINIPSTLTSIGKNAFKGCTDLTSVTLPKGVTSIEEGTFEGCTDLQTINIPSTVTSIGKNAFKGCTSLKTLMLPEGLEHLDYTSAAETAFSGSSFSAVYYPGTKADWEKVENYDKFSTVQCLGIATNKGMATRLGGANRAETSMMVADAVKAALGEDQFKTVVLADASNFPDALTGSYLADNKGAPIILVNKNNYANTVDYVKENLVNGGTVYVLGGTNAVPEKIVNALKGYNGFKVERLFGNSRYLTNLKILDSLGDGVADTLLITSGGNFADSLSASPLGLPMMIVKSTLLAEQKTWLSNNKFDKYIILGGEAAVSANVENALKSDYASDTSKVTRLYGSNRYETSIAIANEYFGSAKGVVLAYASNFPDGLSGGPLAHAKGYPLILTKSGHSDEAAAFTAKAESLDMYVLGGSGLISDEDVAKIGQ